MNMTWTDTTTPTNALAALHQELLASGQIWPHDPPPLPLPSEAAPRIGSLDLLLLEHTFEDVTTFFALPPQPSQHHLDVPQLPSFDEEDDDAEEEDDSCSSSSAGNPRRAVHKRSAAPRGQQSGGGGRRRANVNEMYDLKKFDPALVARLESELSEETLALERGPWKQFMDSSAYTKEEKACAKCLRRKLSSRRYASGTRQRKNEKIETEASKNSALLAHNRRLQAENADLKARVAALEQQLLLRPIIN